MAKKIGMGQDFSFVYPDLSGYVHPDAYSASHYVKLTDDAWKVLLDEPDQDYANRIEHLAIGYTILILECYCKIHGINVPEENFNSVFDKLGTRPAS